MRIHGSLLSIHPSRRFVAPPIGGNFCMDYQADPSLVGAGTEYPVGGNFREVARLYWLTARLMIRRGSYASFKPIGNATGSPQTFTFGPRVGEDRENAEEPPKRAGEPAALACGFTASVAAEDNEQKYITNPLHSYASASAWLGIAFRAMEEEKEKRLITQTVYYQCSAAASGYIEGAASTAAATSIIPPLVGRSPGMNYVECGHCELDFSDQNQRDELQGVANYLHKIPLYAEYVDGFTGYVPYDVLLRVCPVIWHYAGDPLPSDLGDYELPTPDE